jgi:hypothetical protein
MRQRRGGPAYRTLPRWLPAAALTASVALPFGSRVAHGQPLPAAATEPQRASTAIGANVALTTYAPLSVGPEATLELPGRTSLQGHFGWLPGFYADGVAAALDGAGVGDGVGELLREGFEQGTALRLGAGWRPFARAGFQVSLGYLRLDVQGSAGADTLLTIAGDQLPDSIDAEARAAVAGGSVGVSSTIHGLHGAVGWRWVVSPHVLMRASLGYLQAVGSSSSIETQGLPAIASRLSPLAEARLHDQIDQYGKLPVVGLSLAYRP